MKQSLLEAMANRILVGDGAMGTQLQLAELEPGACGEAWNVEHPERVKKIHRAYIDAGSDCITTNTFGGCRITLERHGLAERTADINRAAVRIVREAFGDREGFVIGDIGPFGGVMEPYGDVPEETVRDALMEQASALVEAGADAIILETQTSKEEMALGIEAAKKAGAPCIIGSFAYDVTFDGSEIRTMMGIDPEQAAEFLQSQGVDIMAINCGTGVDVTWAAQAVIRYRKTAPLATMAQPNAGLPEVENLKTVYKQTPEQMAAEIPQLLDTGVNIVGACCGSTPAHIAMIRKLVDARNAAAK